MTVRHGWVITQDHIFDPAFDKTSGVGVSGPSDSPFSPEEIQQKGTRFRLLDGDGELYYEGVFYAAEDEEDGEADFAPLNDYGLPNAGCTDIQFWHPGKGGGWRIL
jgi:hypothetical protein